MPWGCCVARVRGHIEPEDGADFPRVLIQFVVCACDSKSTREETTSREASLNIDDSSSRRARRTGNKCACLVNMASRGDRGGV